MSAFPSRPNRNVLEVWSVRKILTGSSLIVVKKSQDTSSSQSSKVVIIRGIQSPSIVQSKTTDGSKEDPYGWECRQKLIFLLHRKSVLLEYSPDEEAAQLEKSGKSPSSMGRIFANVFYKDVENNLFINVAEKMISFGLASVKDPKGGPITEKKTEKRPTFDEIVLPKVSTFYLKELEEVAKTTKTGMWSDSDRSVHLRNVIFYESFPAVANGSKPGSQQKPTNGPDSRPKVDDKELKRIQDLIDRVRGLKLSMLVEDVMPKCHLKGWLMVPEAASVGSSKSQPGSNSKNSKKLSKNEFHYVTLCFVGLQMDVDNLKNVKEFLEERLIQDQELKVILHGRASVNSLMIMAQLEHPRVGDIGLLMLSRGLVQCQFSGAQSIVTLDSKLCSSYTDCEAKAKKSKSGLWSKMVEVADCSQVAPLIHKGKVIEICPGFSLSVLLPDGSENKFFFANIQFPQPKKELGKTSSYSFHSAPYMYECREFLRKLVVGHDISINVVFSKSFSETGPQKKFCIFKTAQDADVAKLLLAQGLVKMIPREEKKQTDYHKELLQIESVAQKSKLNLFSNKQYVPIRFNDLTAQPKAAKDMLPFFKRAGRLIGLVESLYGAGKVKLYVESQCCMIVMMLTGVVFPRTFRPDATGKKPGSPSAMELVGSKALEFVRQKILQKEIAIMIEDVDKSGNFLGQILLEDGKSKTLTHSLLRQGFCSLTLTAEKSSDFKDMLAEQELAKSKKLNLWNEQNRTKSADKKSPSKAKSDLTTKFVGADYQLVIEPKKSVGVVVTEVSSTLTIWAQLLSKAKDFKDLMAELQKAVKKELTMPLGDWKPSKGQMCVAQFGDDIWYRCVVEQLSRDGLSGKIFYIDYGNRSEKSLSLLRKLPSRFQEIPRYAHELNLAFISAPSDEDDVEYCRNSLRDMCLNKAFTFSRCYCHGKNDHVMIESNETNINVALVENGWVSLCDERTLNRLSRNEMNLWFKSTLDAMKKAQEKAREEKLNIWRYGCVITAEEEIYDRR